MLMKSLHSRIAIALVSVVIVIVATTAILVQHEVSKQVIDSEAKHAQEIANLTLMTISNEYTAYCFHKESLLEERRQTIKHNLSLVFSYIDREYDRFKDGLITEREAKDDIINSLKTLRYNEGIGYFWINDCTRPIPRMIMHPTIPELDGTILDNPDFNCAMGTDKNLFQAFVDVCLSEGEGYVEYLWPKPTPDGLTEKQPKLSFVKLFKQWGWVIGTGVYIDDIENECQSHFNEIKASMFENLAKINIAESGYIYIVSGDDKMQLHPQLIGSDVSSLYNPITNISMTDEIKNAISNGEYIFEYLWSKPGYPEKTQFSKTAYIRYFEPLDWYIVISVYNDELLAPAAAIRTKIIWVSFFFLAFAIFLAWQLGRSISHPIASLAKAARKIEHEGIKGTSLPVDGTIETQVLGTCLQSMVDTLKQEQHELHMLSFLVESAASPIVMSDLDGKLIYTNPAFLKSFGYTNEKEVIDKFFGEFLVGKNDICEIRESIEKSGFLSKELLAIHKDKTEFPIHIFAAIVYDEDNNAIAMMFSPIDITEQKRAQEVINNYNISLQAEVKARTEELLGKNAQLENEIKEREKAENELKTTTSQLIQTEKMATIGQLAAGVAHEINTPLGAISSSCGTLQKQFEDIINNLDAEFEVYKDNKDIFDTMINKIVNTKTELSSREIREKKAKLSEKLIDIGVENPQLAAAVLTGICPEENCKVCLSLFDRENSNEILSFIQKVSDIFNSIRIIDTAIKQSSRVIFALKDYARSEIQQKMIEADIKDTIETAITLYGNKIKHGIELKLDFQDTPSIICHPHELCQIWTNLISNAIHSMDNQGILTISLECNDENVFVIISDTGRGIPQDIKDKIFEPMFTTKPKGEGTGLGLDIVRRILERHSGTISCESTEGKGTTFTVTLPVNQRF